ncbi:MAG TPA: hypothetical protein V6C88_16340, partial [Chroococcidiopsis sp.]
MVEPLNHGSDQGLQTGATLEEQTALNPALNALNLNALNTVLAVNSPQEWDLSDLYGGFDDPRLEEDLEQLRQT